jgi:hypothetical protein
VEEATAASQAMAEQVRGLNEMLARFQVGVAEITAMPSAQAASAARTAAAAAARADRRGANRPWAARAKSKPAMPQARPRKPAAEGASAAAAPRAAARSNGTLGNGDAGDSEWQEF